MRPRVLLSFIIFVYFTLVFFIQKIIFIIAHGGVSGSVGVADTLQIMSHGLLLDMSTGGCMTAIPLLLLVAAVWRPAGLPEWIFDGCFGIMLLVIAFVTVADVMLYDYWGFHADAAVLFYLRTPKGVLAGISGRDSVAGLSAAVFFAILLYFSYVWTVRRRLIRLTPPRHRAKTVFVLTVLAAALFLPVGTGVTCSAPDISRAYFSDRQFLNHAAVNPLYNFLYSLGKSDDLASQYQFYDSDEARQVFDGLRKPCGDHRGVSLLHTKRPNIILCILESFSFDVAFDPAVSPNMHRLAGEGVMFENFYANSFRTDRGLVSIISGYPAHPTVALIKYPEKIKTLPTLPRSLKQAGYPDATVYYGGDIRYAGMNTYFDGACGVGEMVSDENFPACERRTKWGIPDGTLFGRVYSDLAEKTSDAPFFKIILTLSSHEPFDVPTKRFDEPFLNSVNYTDECLGEFVAKLKSTELWENTLLVCLADHAMQGYPKGADNCEAIRFRIPMLWLGGAVKQPATVAACGSQNDLAATLLSQLQEDSSEYPFSRDMLNPRSRKFAFYSYVNGFCMIDSSGIYMYDNDRRQALKDTGDPGMEREAKAFFQMMYLDAGKRKQAFFTPASPV